MLFVLRNIDCGKSCDYLKSTIKSNCKMIIVENDIDAGIDNGGKVISVEHKMIR